MPRAGRFFLFGLFLCLTSVVSAQPLLSIDGYQRVERVKLGRGRCQYSFLAEVSNRGTRSVGNLSATLVATPSSLTVIHGDLYFGDVPAGTTATSRDSFTLQKVRQGCQPWYQPDPAALEWWFQGTEVATIPAAGTPQRATWRVSARGRPVTLLSLDTSEEGCSQVVADAGPDQTVSLGSTVQLDGKGLTDDDCESEDDADSEDQEDGEDDDARDEEESEDEGESKDEDSDQDEAASEDGDSDEDVSGDDEDAQEDSSSEDEDEQGDDDDDSADPTLTFAWRFLERPADSQAVLSDPTLPNPTFEVDLPGEYILELVVQQGDVSSAPDTVVISTENSAPVADAGADQTVFVGDVVVLDGSASSDVDGDPLTYRWDLPIVPDSSLAVLSDPQSMQPEFTVDLPGSYVAKLIVNDGLADSEPARVTITTQNSPPVADAGPDQTLFVTDTGQLFNTHGI